MTDLKSKLAVLSEADRDHKRALLRDLVELLNRQADRGTGSSYSFHDPELAALPVRLSDAQVRLIAEKVGPVLLDSNEAEDVRATAAFVLGKSHTVESLGAITQVIASRARLPIEIARQCAFAFDVLADILADQYQGLDLDAIEKDFERHNIPWNSATHRVAVDDL
jgi:hypothetical protein